MTTEIVEYIPATVMTQGQLTGVVAAVEEAQRKVMRKDVDYGTIPGTPKPSLYKPGAERLLQLFGLGHRIEILETERDTEGNKMGVMVRCTITKGDLDVGASLGWADYDEAGFYKPARGQKPEYRAPWNTVLKMAQKRALVGAALQTCGASGLFTQDVEDQQDNTMAAVVYAVREVIKQLPAEVRNSLNETHPPDSRSSWNAENWCAVLVEAGMMAAKLAEAKEE